MHVCANVECGQKIDMDYKDSFRNGSTYYCSMNCVSRSQHMGRVRKTVSDPIKLGQGLNAQQQILKGMI